MPEVFYSDHFAEAVAPRTRVVQLRAPVSIGHGRIYYSRAEVILDAAFDTDDNIRMMRFSPTDRIFRLLFSFTDPGVVIRTNVGLVQSQTGKVISHNVFATGWDNDGAAFSQFDMIGGAGVRGGGTHSLTNFDRGTPLWQMANTQVGESWESDLTTAYPKPPVEEWDLNVTFSTTTSAVADWHLLVEAFFVSGS